MPLVFNADSLSLYGKGVGNRLIGVGQLKQRRHSRVPMMTAIMSTYSVSSSGSRPAITRPADRRH